MASGSSQPQFRYTQPPSKVLHLRNLPWECTEEELIELGKPFGKVVNTKCNVGANRNQAFIELAELNQAIAMISYYASSSEPAQVRGKTVYLQYSNRQEIVNNKTTADVAGNVLLVTIEGNDARLVSIDVLHLVFSAFGFVHKITTFEKTAGFQALVQFSDAETATSAKDALDGRSIPSYLIPELGPCTLKITYSAHTDLSVKFQSHRSSLGLDGKKLEPESNVLLASIENMQYAVTLDVLHTVFSAFGPVNNDRSRDYTIPNTPMLNSQPSIFGQQLPQIGGPGVHPYGAPAHYAPAPGVAPPQHSAGWNSAAATANQGMPMQMHNHPYMPPGSVPSQMGSGVMPMHGQNGIPYSNAMPPYHQQ
ncbi:polypyrimidine tract-binding protein -like 2, partial [Nicotiana attenuata]